LAVDNDTIEICYGQTAIPSASSADAVSVTWYADANYTDEIVSENSFETATLIKDTIFYVAALSSHGCISWDSVTVIVHPLPDLTVDDTIEICYAHTAVSTVSSADAVSVTWYGDANYTDEIVSANSFETAALITDTTFYIETVSAHSCISRDSVKVAVHPLPDLTVDNDTIEICHGRTAILAASSVDNNVSITWYGDANYTNAIARENMFETAALIADTAFYVEALSSHGCISRDTVTVMIGDSLYIMPDTLPDYTSNTDYSQRLTTNAERPRFTLESGDLPSGLFLNPSGVISGTSIAGDNMLNSSFTVRVEDRYGCSIEKKYLIRKKLSVPKIFTPDGDGINDMFMTGYNVIIFDRLGIEIFKGDNGWDGTYKGTPAPPDIYFYVLYYKDSDGKIITQDGYIGLIRYNKL
jgi:gliding motility-associated-like protein